MAERMRLLLTDFKLKVVELAMMNGNRNDGREYTVNEKLVYNYTIACKCAAFRMRLILQRILK